MRRTGILTLDEQGAVTGQLQIAMTGQEALRWRQAALENDEAEVKKQFDNELETIVPDGVQAHVDHFRRHRDPNANLIAIVNISGTLGTATAKRLMLPGFFFETRGHVPFVNEEKRIEPVDMHYGERVTEQITYRFPAGFAVEGAPPDANIAWPSHALLVAKSLTRATPDSPLRKLSRAPSPLPSPRNTRIYAAFTRKSPQPIRRKSFSTSLRQQKATEPLACQEICRRHRAANRFRGRMVANSEQDQI